MAGNRSLRDRKQTDGPLFGRPDASPKYSWKPSSDFSILQGALSVSSGLSKLYIGRQLGKDELHSFIGPYLPEEGLFPIKMGNNPLVNESVVTCEILTDPKDTLYWEEIEGNFSPHVYRAVAGNTNNKAFNEAHIFIGKVTSSKGVGIGNIYCEDVWKIRYRIHTSTEQPVIDLASNSERDGIVCEVLCRKTV